jgi:hypothetical protein
MNKKKYSLIVFICFKIFFCATTFSQKKTKIINDFESWSSVGFTYKPIKKITLGIEQNLRLKENSSSIEKYFTQLSADYKLFKNFEIGLGYRFVRTQDDKSLPESNYENSKRLNLDATYKNDIKRFSYGVRSRYQIKKDANSSNETLRLKTEIGYNFKKWKLDPEISGEIFYRPNEVFRNYRVTLSTKIDIDKDSSVKLFVLYENELNEPFPKSIYVAGFSFTHRIKFK